MRTWDEPSLDTLRGHEDAHIAFPNPDGTLHQPTWIWVAPGEGEVFVRSYNGPGGRWYNAALERPDGTIECGGQSFEVTALPVEANELQRADEAYLAKYRSYLDSYLGHMLKEPSRGATLKLVPRATS
ncbi:MAG: DUF2255 family protein [Aquiluna sp.]